MTLSKSTSFVDGDSGFFVEITDISVEVGTFSTQTFVTYTFTKMNNGMIFSKPEGTSRVTIENFIVDFAPFLL